MCRTIKKLRRPGELPTEEELHNAALQYVRKISGYHAPSQANSEAFDKAVREVAEAGRTMFSELSQRDPSVGCKFQISSVADGVNLAQH